MDLIFEHSGHQFYRQVIETPSDLTEPFGGRAYPCMLWTHGQPLAPDARFELAERLIASQIRYAVCGGVECEPMHDAIDGAFVEAFLEESPEAMERAHVMTTWHDGEGYEEVAAFFVLNTNFDQNVFTEHLVVHIGGSSKEQAALDVAVRQAASKAAAL